MVIAVATLAMPLTLRFSRTYFNTPGRNLVFLCALLNLAGVSLPLVVPFTSLPDLSFRFGLPFYFLLPGQDTHLR